MTDLHTYLEVGEYSRDYPAESYESSEFFPRSIIILCTETCIFTTHIKYILLM
jgi:hypothetical protein